MSTSNCSTVVSPTGTNVPIVNPPIIKDIIIAMPLRSMGEQDVLSYVYRELRWKFPNAVFFDRQIMGWRPAPKRPSHRTPKPCLKFQDKDYDLAAVFSHAEFRYVEYSTEAQFAHAMGIDMAVQDA